MIYTNNDDHMMRNKNHPFTVEQINKYPGILIVTHDDNDGNASAIEIAQLENISNIGSSDTLYKNVYNIDYSGDVVDKIIECINDYKFKIISPKKFRLFITDISLSFEQIKRLWYNIDGLTEYNIAGLADSDISVYWFDHHTKSVEAIKEFIRFISDIPCSLNWYITDDKTMSACELIELYMKRKNLKSSEYYSNLIKYVNDWDTMTLEYSGTIDVKYYAESFGHVSTKRGYFYWMDLYESNKIGDAIENGQYINDFVYAQYKNKFAKSIYEIEFEGHKCRAICAQEHESRIFGSIDELKDDTIYMVWHYNGTKYVYSIYTSPRSDINCNTIATKYNGGGHVHASGFSLDYPITSK